MTGTLCPEKRAKFLSSSLSHETKAMMAVRFDCFGSYQTLPKTFLSSESTYE